jgi:hypothetical protein
VICVFDLRKSAGNAFFSFIINLVIGSLSKAFKIYT